MKKGFLILLVMISFMGVQAQNLRGVSPVSSQHKYIVMNYSGYAIDIDHARTDNGTNIRLYDRNYTVAQDFRFKATANGYFRLYNENSGKYVSVVSGRAGFGDNIELYQRSNYRTQEFKIIPAGDGYFYLQAKDTKYYIAPQTANPGKETNLVLGSKSQNARWKFQKH